MTKPIDERIFDYTADQTNPFYTHFSYQQTPLRAFIERVTTLEYAINQYQFPIIQQSLNQYLAQHLFTSIMANLECFLRYFFSGVLYLTRYTTNPTVNSSHNDAFKTTTDYNYISTNLISVDKVDIFNRVTDKSWSNPNKVNHFFQKIELNRATKPFFNFNTYTEDTLKNLWQIRHANGHISGILTENDVGKLSNPMPSFSSFIVNTNLIKELIQFLIKVLDEEVKDYQNFFKSKMKSTLTDTEKQEIDVFFSTLNKDTMHHFYTALSYGKTNEKGEFIGYEKSKYLEVKESYEKCIKNDKLHDAYINLATYYEKSEQNFEEAHKLYKEFETLPLLKYDDYLEIACFYSRLSGYDKDYQHITKTMEYADKFFDKKGIEIKIKQDLKDLFRLLKTYYTIRLLSDRKEIATKTDRIFNKIIEYIRKDNNKKNDEIYENIIGYYKKITTNTPAKKNVLFYNVFSKALYNFQDEYQAYTTRNSP